MAVYVMPEKDSSGSPLIKTKPFASKEMDGKKLFKRIRGKEFTLTSGVNTLEFEIPYNQVKMNGLEIINAELGDKVTFEVYDNAAGTISGFPNAKLNEFGVDVNIKPDYYQQRSEYDADLILGMKLTLKYSSVSAKTIYVNYELNECV